MKKVFANIVTLTLVMSMLAGCGGKKEVDTAEGDSEQDDIASQEYDLSEGVERIKTVEHWTDEWVFSAPLYSDERVTVNTMTIDADVTMPDMEAFPVVEVERVDMDDSFRKNFLRAYYRNDDVYLHDEEQLTKDEIQAIIDNLEKNAEGADLELLEMYEGFIQEYEELLATAPESPVEVEDDTCANEYSGTISQDPENVAAEDIENECCYSMEEAKRIADSFLVQIGMSNQYCREVIQPIWSGIELDEEGEALSSEYIRYGYTFVYGTGVDGVPFNLFPNREEYTAGSLEMENNADYTEIRVTDDGVLEVFMMAPVAFRSADNDGEIVPLEEIKEIMKKEANENTDRYNFLDNSVMSTSTTMELVYLRICDSKEEGKYHFEPLWCLSGLARFYHPIFVNAITGEVVYPLESDITDDGEQTGI